MSIYENTLCSDIRAMHHIHPFSWISDESLRSIKVHEPWISRISDELYMGNTLFLTKRYRFTQESTPYSLSAHERIDPEINEERRLKKITQNPHHPNGPLTISCDHYDRTRLVSSSVSRLVMTRHPIECEELIRDREDLCSSIGFDTHIVMKIK
jgi:hypothetical protein